MPELPEVETVLRGLSSTTIGAVITATEVLLERSIAHPDAADFITRLVGKSIKSWHRRGKYLLASLQIGHPVANQPDTSGGTLGVHLRMTGQLLWLPQTEPLQKHTRVRLFFPEAQELRFVDQRTFGKMWWVPPGVAPSAIITGLQKLGPEPLEPEFSPEYLGAKLHRCHRPIKTALLDQTLVAGIGNIYADEALFLSRVPPTTLACDLTPEEIGRLHSSIVEVLHQAIGQGGTTFSDFLNLHGVNGNYAGVAWVYHRTGQPCRVCGTPIDRRKLAGRSTHFCPHCQKTGWL